MNGHAKQSKGHIMATPKQIQKIHVLKGKLGLDDPDYRLLLAHYGVDSSKKMNVQSAKRLIDDLEGKAVSAGVWQKGGSSKRSGKRPHNMEGTSSRAAQLRKIEALLTIGGKSWNYANALAKRICKVDSVTFVQDHNLYKLIAALRLLGQREGWPLND